MNTVRAIFWDLGNVLLRYDHFYVCLRLARLSGRAPQEVKECIYGKSVWGPETLSYQFDIGALMIDDFLKRVRERLKIEFTPLGPTVSRIQEAFGNCFEMDRDIWRLIWFFADKEKCPRVIAQGILSNINVLQFALALDTFSALKLKKNGGTMDFHTVSFEERMVKPMKGIYAAAFVRSWRVCFLEAKYDLKPEECLFLDDRPENIEAAEDFGIKAELVESYGYKNVSAILDRYGIPLPPADYVAWPIRQQRKVKSL